MSLVALVSDPVKPLGVPSNCKVDFTSTEVSLTDDTTPRTFVQRCTFDEVSTTFTPVITSSTMARSSRIISMCSEYSTPTPKLIRDNVIEFLLNICPRERQTVISFGLLFDNEVFDQLSVAKHRTPKFDLIDGSNLDDLLDLVDCGFDQPQRLRHSVFVLHVGDDPFFEWVIVPGCDAFVPTTSALGGLPPNEKLLFILKQFSLYSQNAVARNRRLSSVFQLVCDTFSDIPTKWVFHIPTNVSFKSNAALFNIVGTVRAASSCHFTLPRSQLFQRPSERRDRSDGADAALDSSEPPPEFDHDLEALQLAAELQRLLGVADSDDESDAPRLSAAEEQAVAALREAERRRAEERARVQAEADARARQQQSQSQSQSQQQSQEDDGRQRARKSRDGENEAGIGGDAGGGGKQQRADSENEPRVDGGRQRGAAQQRGGRRAGAGDTVAPSEEEEEGDSPERGEALARIARAREEDEERRSHARHELDDEDAADGRKGLNPEQLQQRKWRRLQLLVARARKAARDPNVYIAELRHLDDLILVCRGDVDRKRIERQRQCLALARERKEARERSEELEGELRRVRLNYLKVHNRKVQLRAKLRNGKTVTGRSDYDIAVQFLKQAIGDVKKDIAVLHLRERTQVLG